MRRFNRDAFDRRFRSTARMAAAIALLWMLFLMVADLSTAIWGVGHYFNAW